MYRNKVKIQPSRIKLKFLDSSENLIELDGILKGDFYTDTYDIRGTFKPDSYEDKQKNKIKKAISMLEELL